MKHTEKIIFAFLLAMVFAAGAVFRLSELEKRPVHGDEANQAVKMGKLLEKGDYKYDSREHHGPTLYYLTLPLFKILGVSSFKESTITEYRLLPALFGIAVVVLAWLLVSPLGRWAGLWAALFTAVAHATTYYSRYYIQETLLIFFVYAVVYCSWRWWLRPGAIWALATGAMAGLAYATKETSVVIFVAMAAAAGVSVIYGFVRDGGWCSKDGLPTVKTTVIHMLMALAMGTFVAVMFFSSFFTNMHGPIDSFSAFSTYANRAGGAGFTANHDKPWHYYFGLLLFYYKTAGPKWSEAPVVVLAVIGALFVLGRKGSDKSVFLARFLVFFTLFLTAGFSLIPYKTPWNLLVFFHGMLLLSGLAADSTMQLFKKIPVRAVVCLIFLGAAAFEARQAWMGNFEHAASVGNPYVYSHTSTAINRLVSRIHDLRAIAPPGNAMQINVIRSGGDYWPLPWYLRDMTRVGYWSSIPENPDAPVIITSPDLAQKLHSQLKDKYFTETQGLRPSVLMPVFIRQDLWEQFMAGRS